jgi:6-phosphogluconolactonase
MALSTTRSVFGSPDALAAELVHQTVETALAAVAARGRFSLALTGGSAAQALYPILAQAPLPWDRVHVLFGDERCVAGDHADSNHRLAQQTLLSRVPIPPAHVHRIVGEDPPHVAAAAYEQALLDVTDGTGALDVVHLGLGPDGHVCSLFPGHPLVHDDVHLVAAITDSPKPPAARVTLTMQALARARHLWFLVAGATKADAAHDAILNPASTLPAAIAARRGTHVRWLLDADAARFLR